MKKKRFFPALMLLLLAIVLGLLLFLRTGGAEPGAAVTEPGAPATQKPRGIFQKPPEELSAVLSAEELRALDVDGLKRLDLSGSRCYEAIESFIAAHPEIETRYLVYIEAEGEQPLALEPDVASVQIENGAYLPSLTENLRWLHSLKTVSISPDAADPAAVDALREAGSVQVDYALPLNGALFPYDAEELTLTGLDAGSLRALLPELERFPRLRAAILPQDGNEIPLEDALALAAECPVLQPDYQLELFGQTLSLSAARIEYENAGIGNAGVEELRALLPYFKKLEYLKLDDCGVDNTVMEALRDDFPDIKVVWRVHFGNYHCLTDTEMIWATGGSVNDSTAGVLKYCTDVKYMDLGHSLITRADFLAYMPKLEVLILAISWVENIEPIVNCPNLEYIEIFSARLRDLSPLAKCTHLQHVNCGSQRNVNNVAVGPTDISALYELPELKRFYCAMSYVPKAQQEKMIELHPDCEFEFGWVDPSKGFWRFKDGNPENSDPANRTERYALLCEQFGYDTLQQSGKMWSLYG